MSGKAKIQWYSILLLAFGLTSCQVKRPKEVLSDAKMENVLYDYHIAKAMGEEVPYSENYKRVLYVESVFKKHGITQADFDTSMVWFTRNPEALTKVYEKVNARLKAERELIEGLIAKRDRKAQKSQPGDSVDVWMESPLYRLTGMPLNNKLLFTLPSDSNFYDRDTLRWSVRFRFHKNPSDSLYAPLMAMQVLYEKNDTTVSEVRPVREPGVETISLYADTLGKIKEVRGFIYYPMQESHRPLLADRISLMRYHAMDTLAVAAPDSLVQVADSLPQKPAADKGKPVKLMETKELKDQKVQVTPVRERRR